MPDTNALNEQEAQRKLEQISTQVASRGLEIPNKQELCEIYTTIKPLLNDVLPWITHLPKGQQIADAIRFLEKIADTVCN